MDSSEWLFLFGLIDCIFKEFDLGFLNTVYKIALSLDLNLLEKVF